MKRFALALAVFVASGQAFAEVREGDGNKILSAVSTAATFAPSIATSNAGRYNKEQVLKNAQGEAAAYVAASGKAIVQPNLRAAIAEIRSEEQFANASELVIVSEILDRSL